METATSSKTLDYNVKQTTISGNNRINTRTDTSSNQSLNTANITNAETETLDLTNEIESQESKGFFETIGDGLKAAGAAISGGASWAINGLKEAGSTIADTAANVAKNVKSIGAKVREWVDSDPVASKIADVFSTGAVVANSVKSGIDKIGEWVNDSLEWVSGKVVEGGALVTEEIVGAFSFEAKESVANWRKDFSKAIKEDIERDKVAEQNKYFYENTDWGRWINAHSAIKYDSEVAKKIQGVTTTVAEIAAATAITIATGGTAAAFIAPFLAGMAVGTGKAAESTYQNKGTDTTILQELGIIGSGALTGLTWVANGKLGQGALNIGKDIISKGGATVLKDMGAQMLNKEFLLNRLKDGLSLKNAAGKININALMNYGQAAMGTAGSLTPYITGEKEFTATSALELGGTYLKYLGLNILEDTARDYVSGYKATGAVTKILTDAEKAELAAIPDPVSASTSGQGIDASTSKTVDNLQDNAPTPKKKIKYTDIDMTGPFDEQLDGLKPGTYEAIEGTRIPVEAVFREPWDLYQYGDTYPEAIKKIEELYGPKSIQATTARSVVIKEVIDDLQSKSNYLEPDLEDWSWGSGDEAIIKKAQFLFEQAGLPSRDYSIGLRGSGSGVSEAFDDDLRFWSSLTNEERVPMLSYTGGGFVKTGESLRTGIELDEKMAEDVRVLSEQLESRPGLPERTLLYRGYHDLNFIDESFANMSKSELADAINKLADGTVVIGDNSFCSSSISYPRSLGFGEIHEICSVAEGTKGAFVGAESTNGFECEYILQAGTGNRKIILGAECLKTMTGEDLIIYTAIP